MGKASSSKKVARAARAGGAASGRKRQWAFPAALIAIFVVGVSIVAFARGSNEEAAAVAPAIGDHWHAAYGIYVCDQFLDPLTDVAEDKLGIHTHGDGIMHVHPFSGGAAGSKATFKVFGETTGISFQSDGFTMPDGTVYQNGYDCNGQPATVKVYQWNADDTSAAPTVYTKDFGNIRFSADRLAFTIAVVPEGTDVPPPETIPTLDNLTDVTGGATTTAPLGAAEPSAGSSSTTAPVDPSASSSTTVAPQ